MGSGDSRSARFWRACLVLFVAAGSAACGAEDDRRDRLTLTFFGSGGEGTKPRTLEDGLVLDEVWIGLSTMTLTTGPDCAAGGEGTDATLAGPAAIDLLNGASLPGEFRLPTQPIAYCGFEADIVPVGDEALGFVPEEMQGRSIWVRGHRADGTEFQILDDFESHVSTGPGMPFFARPPVEGVIGQFYVDQWIDAASLDGEIVDDPGSGEGIRIDSTHRLYGPFRAAVSESMGLFILVSSAA